MAFASTLDTAVSHAAVNRTPTPAAQPFAEWEDLLRKPDGRLIRDIGLTREEIEGPEKAFWREWARQKTIWNL